MFLSLFRQSWCVHVAPVETAYDGQRSSSPYESDASINNAAPPPIFLLRGGRRQSRPSQPDRGKDRTAQRPCRRARGRDGARRRPATRARRPVATRLKARRYPRRRPGVRVPTAGIPAKPRARPRVSLEADRAPAMAHRRYRRPRAHGGWWQGPVDRRSPRGEGTRPRRRLECRRNSESARRCRSIAPRAVNGRCQLEKSCAAPNCSAVCKTLTNQRICKCLSFS